MTSLLAVVFIPALTEVWSMKSTDISKQTLFFWCLKKWLLKKKSCTLQKMSWGHALPNGRTTMHSNDCKHLLDGTCDLQCVTVYVFYFSDSSWSRWRGNCGLFLWRITSLFAINPHSSELCLQFSRRRHRRLELLNLRAFEKSHRHKNST